MKTIAYSIEGNNKNTMKDNNFNTIKEVIVNAFNHIYSFDVYPTTNTSFIMRWDNEEAEVGKASLIRVHVDMHYNMINDNYIANLKLSSEVNDGISNNAYYPNFANNALEIGFDTNDLVSGVNMNELVTIITDLFIDYFAEQRRNINAKIN